HAIAREKLAIARELHDVVAHHLSALAAPAGAAPDRFPSHPAAARPGGGSMGSRPRGGPGGGGGPGGFSFPPAGPPGGGGGEKRVRADPRLHRQCRQVMGDDVMELAG
ncbi:hypothetical protein ADK49_08560, partial [Streptomyces sp. WM6349]